MCCVAIKYTKEYGWIGSKNRDRNYKTMVNIVTSNRRGVQRLFIDDQTTRWTEGVNEFGVAIISASFSVKSDEKEGDKIAALSDRKKKAMKSPDGLAIRTALFEKTPEAAAKILVERELAGATFIFSEKQAFLLEGGFTVKKENATKENPRKYIYSLKEIKKDESYCVRTNHGIDLPQLGYSKNATDPKIQRSRESSENRHKAISDHLKKHEIADPVDLLDAMSVKIYDDPFMNPVRIGDTKKAEMVTTGQLLINPKERCLHYRPIYSSVSFTYDKLNRAESKTFFEIISTRKLLSFKEHANLHINSFIRE